jgi:hypothetical protein
MNPDDGLARDAPPKDQAAAFTWPPRARGPVSRGHGKKEMTQLDVEVMSRLKFQHDYNVVAVAYQSRAGAVSD